MIPAQLTAGDAAGVAGVDGDADVDGSVARTFEVGALDGTCALGGTGGVLAHAARTPMTRAAIAIKQFIVAIVDRRSSTESVPGFSSLGLTGDYLVT